MLRTQLDLDDIDTHGQRYQRVLGKFTTGEAVRIDIGDTGHPSGALLRKQVTYCPFLFTSTS